MLKFVKYHWLSLRTVFKYLFKKAVTLEYPEEKNIPPENFRGKPVVTNICIKCGTCKKVCPTGAITIQDNDFQIDLKKCIFCGNCSYYCPKKAITMSKDYELALNNPDDLKLNYKIERENNV